MKYLFFALITTYTFGQEVFYQKCKPVFGNGPFKNFIISYDLLELGEYDINSIKVSWSKSTVGSTIGEVLNDVKIIKKIDNLDTPQIDIEMSNIGEWGSGTINIGSDESRKVSALVTFSNDVSGNRGFYKCTRFSKKMLQNLYF